ncbi:UNVERIFIED_CONTAM: hypothetical protein Slati_1153700 [Sesamum latifolium]|uniref:Uncharacterized protein n=1 Tax=Sesamum latifolium TaxID=2727402 RepID=A0AAW2XFU8_9LAMI
MNTIADDIFLQCFHGSLSMNQTEKERRPYHRNCSCKLHKSKDANSRVCLHHKNVKVMKKSWYKCSLSLEVPQFQRSKEENNAWKIGRIDQWRMM